ncbi:MAG TPA: hypothetical protein PKJ24_00660 [Prolixibacteraceae bacterium]|nr:hypothetical protein [Prolixibacteraceae bacterium]
MREEIIINSNSGGFINSPGYITFQDNDFIIEGKDYKNLTTRRLILLFQFLIAVILFLMLEKFIIYQLFGDIMNSWLEFFKRTPNISALHIVGLFKVLLGFLILILFPLIGSYWISYKIFRPVKIKYSTDKALHIDHNRINSIYMNDKLDVELDFTIDRNESIVFSITTMKIFELFFSMVTDIPGFINFIKGNQMTSSKDHQFIINIFNTEWTFALDGIEFKESFMANEISDTVVLNYLFIELIKFKRNVKYELSNSINEINYQKDKTLKENFELINSNIKRCLTNMEKNITKYCSGENIEKIEDTYKIKISPKIDTWIGFKKNAFGNKMFHISFDNATREYFGDKYILQISRVLTTTLPNEIIPVRRTVFKRT